MEERGAYNARVRRGSQACASVEVMDTDGNYGIGTAFHVGNGIYLTARHVIDGKNITKVEPYLRGHMYADEVNIDRETLLTSMHFGDEFHKIYTLRHSSTISVSQIYFHPNHDIDVAALKLVGIDPHTPALALGGHYDDWIDDLQWLLTKGIVFGYPPVPMTKEAILVVDEVTINAVVNTYRDRYVRFAVSGIPRGGFSGGPVWHQWDFVLGMVTEALEYDKDRNQGYLTVLSIEALRECLDANSILPDCQKLDEALPD